MACAEIAMTYSRTTPSARSTCADPDATRDTHNSCKFEGTTSQRRVTDIVLVLAGEVGGLRIGRDGRLRHLAVLLAEELEAFLLLKQACSPAALQALCIARFLPASLLLELI